MEPYPDDGDWPEEIPQEVGGYFALKRWQEHRDKVLDIAKKMGIPRKDRRHGAVFTTVQKEGQNLRIPCLAPWVDPKFPLPDLPEY